MPVHEGHRYAIPWLQVGSDSEDEAVQHALGLPPSSSSHVVEPSGGVVGADGVGRALPTSASAAAARELLAVVVASYVRSEPAELGAALAAIRQAKEEALVGALAPWCWLLQPCQ